jgi:hypothetical protein
MSRRSVCWINVSQRPTHRQAVSIASIFVLLTIGSLAVAFRIYLCQAQAYAIIVLTIIAGSTMLLHTSQRRESLVKIKKEVYCADLSQTSHIAVTPGRLSGTVVSSYEQLYFTRVRVWVPLIVWLVWVAYGALFHSGPHTEHVSHELLIDISNVGDETPAMLRVARLYLLVFCALSSMAITQWFRRRDARESEVTIVKMSEGEQRWQCRIWLLFALLLFFPARESTAQALLPMRLLARTSLFLVLFVLSESVNRLVHYERWIRCYHGFTQAILVAIQISLGKAKTMPLKEERAQELVKCIDKMEPPPPVLEPRKQNSPDLLTNEIVKYCAVLQSSWVLFASEAVYPVALFQVLVFLFMNRRLRQSVVQLVHERSAEFFIVNQDPLTQQLPVTSRNNFRNRNLPTTLLHEEEDREKECPPRTRAPSQIARPVLLSKISAKESPEKDRLDSPVSTTLTTLKSSPSVALPSPIRKPPVPRTLSIPRHPSTPPPPQPSSPPHQPSHVLPTDTPTMITTAASAATAAVASIERKSERRDSNSTETPPAADRAPAVSQKRSESQLRRAALARLEAPPMDATS